MHIDMTETIEAMRRVGERMRRLRWVLLRTT